MLTAMNDVRGPFRGLLRHAMSDGVVRGGDHVAEDTVFIFGGRPAGELRGDAGSGLGIAASDVGVAPRGPEMIHIQPSISG